MQEQVGRAIGGKIEFGIKGYGRVDIFHNDYLIEIKRIKNNDLFTGFAQLMLYNCAYPKKQLVLIAYGKKQFPRRFVELAIKLKIKVLFSPNGDFFHKILATF